MLVWHALGQAASGAFARVIASRLAAHGLHPYAIDDPGFTELGEALGDVIGEWAERVGIT